MNPAHLHLAVCHLPVAGLAFSIGVAICGLVRKNRDFIRLAFVCYILCGIFVSAAFATGDGAEKVMELFPGIGEDQIGPHENMAMFFFIGLMMIAAAAIVGLIESRNNETLLRKFNLVLLVCAILVAYSAFLTARSGGLIRHEEVKTAPVTNGTSPG